jgi:hypoxanthine phosphoribosyltransferase
MNDVVTEVIPEAELRTRVQELGRELSAAFPDSVPVLVGVITGSMLFLADLVRAMDVNVEVDFLGLSRFGEGGRVRIVLDCATELAGRDVVIVEDIVDTGLTLTSLRRMLEARDCASVQTVALLDKVTRRIVEVPVEYRGFEVGDEFLVGYGLDFEDRFRNLSSIWAVQDLAVFTEDPGAFARDVFPRSGDNLTR